MKEMEKVYNPTVVEERLYQHWEENGYFHAVPSKDKKPYTIVMPPPNITGQLHMGHALDNMMQDVMIRAKRMQGFCALWLPGTDHASIATELKIVAEMADNGLTKQDMGRYAFLEKAWEWKAQYGGRIVQQLRKLGSSCDWERERFTMDEGCSVAVTEVFIRLYEKGLIYQGNRIINWCTDCHTALSDAEVEHEEMSSHLWHIRYPLSDGSGSVVVATTRPETMLGDTAVAVNPKDERYTHLVGKMIRLPLMNRDIPIVADDYVEKDFGSGAVKITPAHDPNDYEVALRHNLPMPSVMDDKGMMNENAGAYAGLDRFTARKHIVADLQAQGLMVKIEDYTHNVGHCYRCHTIVEPMISKQWFVSMKPLAEPAINAVREGDVAFVPERFDKTYFHWLENIRDWCISRQLWWGHRIPAYYCDSCGETIVAKEMPTKCSACGCETFTQDEDVLDTWFSSALWPFSTLGWPGNTEDLTYFYPTDVLITGYDIIFFWVIRMVFSGLEHTGIAPFKHVLIHGIVRDAQGRKMSKSLGNGIDPLEIIEKYGADALRFSLAIGNSPGNDMRFYDEKVESSRNFTNKIWNASRFVLMNIGDEPVKDVSEVSLDLSDKWILSRINGLTRDITDYIERFELGLATQALYDFIWSEFCDWYIEMAKPRMQGDGEGRDATCAVLVKVLQDTLKLLHPFMPFITEEIYSYLPNCEGSLMLSAWPVFISEFQFDKEEQLMENVMEIIRAVRNQRAEMNVPPSRQTRLLMLAKKDKKAQLEKATVYFKRLCFASEVSFLQDKSQIPTNAVSVVCPYAEVFLPLAELVDISREIERAQKEIENLDKEIMRAQNKLSNSGFTDKAPAHVIDEERNKLVKYEELKKTLHERLEMLRGLSL